MANNRMSVRCIGCGEERLLFKSFGGPWKPWEKDSTGVDGEALGAGLVSWVAEHDMCAPWDSTNSPEHYRLVYEHGDPDQRDLDAGDG